MNKDKYTCPVCGNPNLREPPEPWTYSICSCCRTQFGRNHHGFPGDDERLRQAWIDSGAEWWYKKESPPPDWDPFEQMRQAGLSFDKKEP